MNRWLEFSGRFYKYHIIGNDNIVVVIEFFPQLGRKSILLLQSSFLYLANHTHTHTHTNTLTHTLTHNQMERVWV